MQKIKDIKKIMIDIGEVDNYERETQLLFNHVIFEKI